MKNILFKGHLSAEAFDELSQAWKNDDLILFLPPTLKTYDFVKFLPAGEIQLKGELWEDFPDLPNTQYDFKFKQKPVAGVFSSGSTQEPKLILYSKENIKSSVDGVYSLFDDKSYDSIFCYPQPYHTFGLTLGFGGSLLRNKNLIFQQGHYSTKHHEKWNESTQKLLTLGTPTHFQDLVAWSEEKNIDPSYACIIGGARVTRQLWMDLQTKVKISAPSIGYGATEASPGVSHLPPGQEPLEDGEVGFPLEHVSLENRSSGLKFSGPNLCIAIIENGVVTQPESLVLPDLVETRDDGVLIYKARLNWFLNRGGEKFSLERFEKIIFDDLGIETLGFCVKDDRLGEDLGLLIKGPESVANTVKGKIIDLLKSDTGRKFESKNMLNVDEFPLNSSQKNDRLKAFEIFEKRTIFPSNQATNLFQDQSGHSHLR